MLAYVTVVGFIVRAIWSITDSPMKNEKWVRIVPHLIDTTLLTLGVLMAINLSISPVSGWLGAKLAGLVSYIGFGVLTMRANTVALKGVGLVGALASVGYIFSVAFTREVWPF
jgi:uncharacterized membrane protein SirB2